MTCQLCQDSGIRTRGDVAFPCSCSVGRRKEEEAMARFSEPFRVLSPMADPEVKEFLNYIISDEYRSLLRKAIADAGSFRAYHAREHITALDLFDAAFPDGGDE